MWRRHAPTHTLPCQQQCGGGAHLAFNHLPTHSLTSSSVEAARTHSRTHSPAAVRRRHASRFQSLTHSLPRQQQCGGGTHLPAAWSLSDLPPFQVCEQLCPFHVQNSKGALFPFSTPSIKSQWLGLDAVTTKFMGLFPSHHTCSRVEEARICQQLGAKDMASRTPSHRWFCTGGRHRPLFSGVGAFKGCTGYTVIIFTTIHNIHNMLHVCLRALYT